MKDRRRPTHPIILVGVNTDRTHLPNTFVHNATENEVLASDLHLATSMRSFRAERLSDFVGHVVDGNAAAAASIKDQLPNSPLLITRELESDSNRCCNAMALESTGIGLSQASHTAARRRDISLTLAM